MNFIRLSSCIAMVASAMTLSTSVASAAVIVINQSSVTFVPGSVNAQVGDTIRWVWNGGGHTITNGVDCEPLAVPWFDAELNSRLPIFEWVVAPSAAGLNISYFCMPHCFFGMVGTIVVAPLSIPGDINLDGFVNGQDLTALLSAWGTATPGADVDGDGIVGGSDLTALMANWTG